MRSAQLLILHILKRLMSSCTLSSHFKKRWGVRLLLNGEFSLLMPPSLLNLSDVTGSWCVSAAIACSLLPLPRSRCLRAPRIWGTEARKGGKEGRVPRKWRVLETVAPSEAPGGYFCLVPWELSMGRMGVGSCSWDVCVQSPVFPEVSSPLSTSSGVLSHREKHDLTQPSLIPLQSSHEPAPGFILCLLETICWVIVTKCLHRKFSK